MQKRYHFDLVCPRCGKRSETTSENRTPSPHVNCGDCLMDCIEIVEFKVLDVREETI
jgi:hypothetical protein